MIFNAEIIRVTARTGDVLTINRAQEGTSAIAIVSGFKIANTITNLVFTQLEAAISGAGTGSVTSVGITATPILTVTNSPITIAGDIDLALTSQNANKALAGPTTGPDATPAFRALVEADLSLSDVTTNNVSITKHGFAPKSPNDASKYLDGTGAYSVPPGAGSGSVTSVSVAVPAVLLSQSGSPITTAGSITLALVTQNANKVLAGPTTGADATPTFRQVIEADLNLTDVTTGNVVSTKHGFAPKSPSDATQFLNGAATPAYAQVKDSDLSTSDITTNNATTAKHGFLPKLSNVSTQFLNGVGSFATPAFAFTLSSPSYSSTLNLDFTAADFFTVTLAGNITFTTSNLAAARCVSVRIVGDGSIRNLTFPGTWTFIGSAAPTALAASKTAILSLTSFSTTDANVIAAYAVQP
jgi:hypothetical protein